MPDNERVLGELLEFKRYMTREMGELRKEIKGLSHFRWKVTGIATAVSAIVAFFAHWFIRQSG
jgi:hypothetical protein